MHSLAAENCLNVWNPTGMTKIIVMVGKLPIWKMVLEIRRAFRPHYNFLKLKALHPKPVYKVSDPNFDSP